jgi:hypothetical protein
MIVFKAQSDELQKPRHCVPACCHSSMGSQSSWVSYSRRENQRSSKDAPHFYSVATSQACPTGGGGATAVTALLSTRLASFHETPGRASPGPVQASFGGVFPSVRREPDEALQHRVRVCAWLGGRFVTHANTAAAVCVVGVAVRSTGPSALVSIAAPGSVLGRARWQ